MDIASLAGIVLALAGILGGMVLEGGSLAQITQPTALLIVLGGTIGAVMLQFPLPLLAAALTNVPRIFFSDGAEDEAVLGSILLFAVKARKDGMLSLDRELNTLEEGFLRQALMLAVDGVAPADVRQIMQMEIDNSAELEERLPQVFESAGGFAPTVGILGAVLGLIQVMQHLENIDAVGRGIASAFVATIYGVGLANLILLPVAGKLKLRIHDDQMNKRMMLEGVISMIEGMNPRMIEMKLRTFLQDSGTNVKSGERPLLSVTGMEA